MLRPLCAAMVALATIATTTSSCAVGATWPGAGATSSGVGSAVSSARGAGGIGAAGGRRSWSAGDVVVTVLPRTPAISIRPDATTVAIPTIASTTTIASPPTNAAPPARSSVTVIDVLGSAAAAADPSPAGTAPSGISGT
ncbi:hypothetical protein ACFQV8_29490 [Pseudonocardia benzenivorans]